MCTTHLGIKPPGQLRLDHHDNDAKHPADQGVVAELLPFAKQCAALAQPVADVPVPLGRWRGWCHALGPFLPDQLLLSGGLEEGILQDGPVEDLGGPLLSRVRVLNGRGVQHTLAAGGRVLTRRDPVGGESGVVDKCRVVDGCIAGWRCGPLEQGHSGTGRTELGFVVVLDDKG